jgi:hypothetical protein
LVAEAYAQEGLSPEVEQAALRRKDRKASLSEAQAKGIIGENKEGLVQIRLADQAGAGFESLVNQENADRLVIYKAVAQKNGTSVEEVKKLYAKRLQNDAPSGTPVEVVDETNGAEAWGIK